MKTCNKCGIEKELTEFGTDNTQNDRHNRTCRLCKSAKEQAYYQQHKQQILSYHKRWRNQEGRALHKISQKKYSDNNRDVIQDKNYRYRMLNQEKIMAHSKVGYAIKTGILIPEPCKCGKTKVHGHHEDYSKPLEVVWLCSRCHSQRHKEIDND